VINDQEEDKKKSRNAETWATNSFEEWRHSHGFSTTKSIADLPKKLDLHAFVDILFKFILRVRKQDGSRDLPPTS
jgi:hypothetical protein